MQAAVSQPLSAFTAGRLGAGARPDAPRPASRRDRPGGNGAGAGRFLFEEAPPADARSALVAAVASVLIHIPLLPVVGLFAPRASDAPRYRDISAVLDALMEENEVVEVDLAKLGTGDAFRASPGRGPAPGVAALSENPAAHGSVTSEAPERRSEAIDPGELPLDAHLPPPPELARAGAGRGPGLSPEEERAMRARWFRWYRYVLGRRIYSTYPRSCLERKGVRGSLTFRLELFPDGAVKSVKVTRADSPAMRSALDRTIESIGSFPGYEATGLDFFPPFVFSIRHGPREWRALSSVD